MAFKAAVRLAPCAALYDGAWWCGDFDEMQADCALLLQTSCALRSMTLQIFCKGVVLVALAIQRQALLGRLRKLRIQLNTETSKCPGVHFLLEIVDNIAGIKNILSLAFRIMTCECSGTYSASRVAGLVLRPC